MKYFQIYLSFIITKNKNKSLFEKELEGKTEIPQSKMRQVTNFTSCADKMALFCKVKHSVQTAFVRMFIVTGSGCVSFISKWGAFGQPDCYAEVKGKDLLFFCKQFTIQKPFMVVKSTVKGCVG